MELPTDEVLLASAINFLFEGQEIYEASLLLLCNIKTHPWNRYDEVTTLMVEIIGSRAVYDILQNDALPSKEIIQRAFNAVLPFGYGIETVAARVDLVNINSSNWREMMEEVLEGEKALNQCIPIKDREIYYWDNLRFRSPPEIAIAQVLNEYEVLFLPNCMARLGSPKPDERKNREADFLVCFDGKWGIIEVDGETIHTNAARDHDRDRLFRTHRIRVIERFTAKECISDPRLVVKKFLELLKKNG
jgi:hypothetical protein